MDKYAKKRDSGVELLRIIGCLIVIAVHTKWSPVLSPTQLDYGKAFLACLFSDGVAVFWLITGFFLFSKSNYTSILVKTLRSIIIPLLMFTLFGFYFGRFIAPTGASLSQSISHTPSEYMDLIIKILTFQNPVQGLEHLWYLYAYAFCMLLYPALNGFVEYIDQSKIRTHCFMLVSVLLLLINDLASNQLCSFSFHTFGVVSAAGIFIIWGHIIYQYRDYFIGSSRILSGLSIYFGINFIRFLICNSLFKAGISYDFVLSWETSFGLFSSTALAICCFSLIPRSREHSLTPLQVVINAVASHTFIIYLIHLYINDILYRMGFQGALLASLQNQFTTSSVFYDIVWSLAIVSVNFFFSLSVAIIMKLLFRLIKSIFNSYLHSARRIDDAD